MRGCRFVQRYSSLYQVREAQLAQYNFILVVGEKEAQAKSVNIRTRDNEVSTELNHKNVVRCLY